MNKELRSKWEEYLFEEGKDYDLKEAITKASKAVAFLKDKGVRVNEDMLLDVQQFDKDFRLSSSEKLRYTQLFIKEGYGVEDCVTMVNVMDVIYHIFDVSKEKACEMTLYAADNHLTVTKTIKNKLDIDFDEIGEFINNVLPEIAGYFLKRTIECGDELRELINEAINSLN